MAPLVSIIIPCFNPGRMLEVCLSSCFAQTHSNIEIILVDNNSTDDSPAFAERLGKGQKHRLRVVNCAEQGHTLARNFGLGVAQGDYIQWLDADDELSPNKIERQVAALEADSSSDIAHCDWEWRFLENGKLVQVLRFPSRQQGDYLLCLLANHWSAPHAYLLRRDAAMRLHACGVWGAKTTAGADREYFSMAALIGCRFLYVPGCGVIYNRWSTTQVTGVYSAAKQAPLTAGIFARLRAQAEKEPAARFTPEHRWLLNQDWSLYRPAIANDALVNDHGLNAAEKNILSAAATASNPLVLEEHAACVALFLWLNLLRQSPKDAPKSDTLRRLRQAIGMPSALDPESEREALNLPVQIYPYLSPVLMTERLAIHHILARLASQGLLTEASAATSA